MNAYEYLGQIHLLDTRISARQLEVEDLRYRATGLKGIRYDKESVQTSVSGDMMVDTLIKIAELEDKINKMICEMIEKRNLIINQIQSIGDWRYEEVLYRKYIQYKTSDEIGEELGYDPVSVRRLLSDARREFGERFLNNAEDVTECYTEV